MDIKLLIILLFNNFDIFSKSLSGLIAPPHEPSIFFPEINSKGFKRIFSVFEGCDANINFPWLRLISEKPSS